jgi:hypothetical protein
LTDEQEPEVLGTYGDTAKSWESIVEFYRGLAADDAVFQDIAALALQLATSHFRSAGLCGLTSLHDLILGPSRQVLNNPYLIVKPDFNNRKFTLVYEDGTPNPWSKTVSASEGYSAIVRVLTKRARWYHESGGRCDHV